MEGTRIALDGAVGREAVRLQVLGPLNAVRHDGSRIELGGPRPRRVLLALAADVGRVVPLDRLATRVWGDTPPDDPRASLHTIVSRLRQALGTAVIETDATGYRLAAGTGERPAAAELDASTFGALVDAAERNGVGLLERLALLDRALALWTGPAFDEVAGEDWARPEIDRLEELRLVATERRFDAMLAAGKHSDAVADLAAAVDANPLRERLVGQQMVALVRVGRQVEATRVFQAHRARLATDLGLEPGAELVALDRRIVGGDPALQLVDAAATPGRPLRGYRLGEQLGEGAFAVVYRGTQPTLGRDVAVKVIRAELANRPEFIRRFEAEAHLVAAIEHPHVVPLYDYWREPDRAYLVFRYLRGGTLEARLTAGAALPLDGVRKLVTQLGGALAAAHDAGVVHRDVKPANVFLDEAGNFYLGDFGIALEGAELVDPTAALSAGSPAYAAPEQLRREPIGPQADVHGLGITVFEALSGELPFPDAVTHADLLQRQLHQPIPPVRGKRHDVPPEVDEVLARATAKLPTDRFPTMADFVETFLAALEGAPPTERRGRRGASTVMSGPAERNPYKGLRAFGEPDAVDFKGRARLVDRLVAGLSRRDTAGRLAVVVGPSGIGKSSVVRAGLLPALRRGAVAGSERWFVATMLPGRDPFEELGAALLRIAASVPDNLMGQLTADHRGLARVVKALVPDGDDGGAVLLVIDQLEELFTLCEDDAVRRRFLDTLEYALTDARCPLRLVATMRADFYDRPLRHGSFARLIEPSTVPVTALAPDELEAAIVEPAAAVGCEFEPGLVSEIVADVSDQPGALPLLQFALTALWERRVSGLLTRDAYRAVGGVTGALAATAERLYDEASETEQHALRRLFGRLVTLGEGVADTRRRVAVGELVSTAGLDEVIERFGAARLLSFDRDPGSREPTVEVAHEALLREWPRLRGWLGEDRDGLRVLRHLTVASAAWEASGRDPGELYRGGRLETAEGFAAERSAELNAAEREFLSASVQRRQVEVSAARRQVRRLRGALAGVGVVAVLALVAGLLAVRQGRRADSGAERAVEQSALASASAAEAETRRLVADAAALVGENRDVALLLASEAYRREPGPQTLAGLHRVLTSTGRYLGTIGAGLDFLGVEVLADGTIVGATETDLRFYDPATAAERRVVPLPAKVVNRPPARDVFVAAGGIVAISTKVGVVMVDGDGEPQTLRPPGPAVGALAVRDGRLAVGTSDGNVHLVDLASGKVSWSTQVIFERTYREVVGSEVWNALAAPLQDFYIGLEPALLQDGPINLAIDASGRVVVAAAQHVLTLDSATGRIISRVIAPARPETGVPVGVSLLATLPDGRIVSGSAFNAVVFDATLGSAERRAIPTGRQDTNLTTYAVVVGPDGTPIWGLSNGQLVAGLTDSPISPAQRDVTGLTAVRGLAIASDGRMLAAGGGGIVAWGADGRGLLARAVPSGGHSGATVSDDGSLVVASTINRAVPTRTYDLRLASPRLVPWDYEPGHIYAAGWDPLGRYVEAWRAGETRFLDAVTQEVAGVVDDASFVGYSFDGSLVAAARTGVDELRVLDASTFTQVSPMLVLTPWAGDSTFVGLAPGFDPAGKRLFASLTGAGTTVVFDTTTWKVIQVIEPDDHGGVVAARFGRDGRTLVTIGIDGTISLREPNSWAFVRELAGGVSASDNQDLGLYVREDGDYLLTTRDGKPRLWHLPTATMIGAFPHQTGLAASGSDLGEHLQLVTLDDTSVYVWNLDVDTWPAIACQAAGRNLTRAEWEQFGPKNEPYHATCASWAPGV